MNQSITYATARAMVRTGALLDSSRMNRLVAAQSVAETWQILEEYGYGGDSLDDTLLNAQKQTVAFFRETCPDEAVLLAFLSEIDVQNLKKLFKGRLLKQQVVLRLSGVYATSRLEAAVRESDYHALPDEIQKACFEIEQRFAVGIQPKKIDEILDGALFSYLASLCMKIDNQTVCRYFSDMADLKNLMLLLRTKRLDYGVQRLEQLLLPGGKIERQRFSLAYENPELLASSFEEIGLGTIVKEAIKRFEAEGDLQWLEKMTQDHLLLIFREKGSSTTSLEPYIGYYLGRQREFFAIRLIMTGKQNGFAPDVIKERLCERYV